MSNLNPDFSRILTLLRREQGLPQRTAAQDMGISQALLSHYENGVREPGLAFVVRACDYYHVSADFLLGRTMDKDGAIISSDEVYDASQEKGTVVKTCIMATLQKKLLVNTISVLFELLGKLGSKAAINAAGSYLGAAIYRLYRYLYRASGRSEEYFSLSNEDFYRGGVTLTSQKDILMYTSALKEAVNQGVEFPDVNPEAIARDYPGLHQSVTQVLHNTDHRTEKLLSF